MLAFPYALSFLSGHLRVGGVNVHLQRFDEQSGSGDGRIWTAELSGPLWQVALTLSACEVEVARRIDAKLRALQGSKKAFLWTDPSYRPASNPGGSATISTIAGDRSAVSIAGLPPYYAMRAGDRFSILWGVDRHYLAEAAEDAIASSAGVIAGVSVMPFLPFGITAGAAINLSAPILKLFVPPRGHTPYLSSLGGVAQGGALSLLQRI